jgi:hypothetical protein
MKNKPQVDENERIQGNRQLFKNLRLYLQPAFRLNAINNIT